jgi:hypothetical protein
LKKVIDAFDKKGISTLFYLSSVAPAWIDRAYILMSLQFDHEIEHSQVVYLSEQSPGYCLVDQPPCCTGKNHDKQLNVPF